MPERPPSLHAYFGYRDAPAALRWLERAFGFETLYEVPDGEGGIMHSEVKFGAVAFMVFSDAGAGYDRPARKGDSVGQGMYVSVEQDATVDTIHASAAEAGATVIWAPEATEWGSYRCRVLDLEGYEWTFGTLHPGQAPEGDWS